MTKVDRRLYKTIKVMFGRKFLEYWVSLLCHGFDPVRS